MRILFVSQFFPVDAWTASVGVHQRMGMFIDALKDLADLDVLFFVPSSVDTSAPAVKQIERSLSGLWNARMRLFLCRNFEDSVSLPTLRRAEIRARILFAGAISVMDHAPSILTSGPQQVRAFEACLDRSPDAVFAHRLGAMGPVLLTRRSLPPVFFDLDDVEHVAHRRRSGRRSLRAHARASVIYWGEYRAIRRAHRTFVCSDADRDQLNRLFRTSRVVTVPNAVTAPEPGERSRTPTLLFLGTYAHHPNVQAAQYLLEQIWPRIREALPEARLLIAGPYPERIQRHSGDSPGVTFTGFVDDLRALYDSVRVVCCPMHSGGGTRIKIIEAAAHGKPVVSTSIGAEGLEMDDGKDILIRDDPQCFAAACVQLLWDDQSCERLGRAARATAVRRFDRATTIRRVQQEVSRAVPQPA